MSLGEVLTRGTIDVALVLYFVVVANHLGFAASGRLSINHRWSNVARWLWTAGGVALVLHIGAAFHYYHQWSHAAAVADTARQTGEIIGWKFGEGIYFNYLFAAVWLGDCFWWWRSPQSYWLRARWMTAAIHAYLAFIAFQAVVVFEEGMVRVVGIAATAALVILAGRFWFAGRRKSA